MGGSHGARKLPAFVLTWYSHTMGSEANASQLSAVAG